ncbi:uncharacterized protein LOC113300121 [Papaver somniferum]|uniref:uncharacterized protein LOC113300121 n=1 Tax=Papaver somniferum TaxID=3469 RepID=UPI000E6FD10F|nr:uncharacterized protein LOC113300121 [Papaver somniferum]
MDGIDRNHVYELNSKNGYWSDSWSGGSIVCRLTNGGVISTAEMLFVQMSKRDTIWLNRMLETVLRSWNDGVFSSYPSFVYTGSVFDRGRGYFNFADAYRIGVDTHNSGLIVLIELIFMNERNRNCVYKVIKRHGYRLKWLFQNSIVLQFVTTGDRGDNGQLFSKWSQGNRVRMNTHLSMCMLMCAIRNIYQLFHQMLDMWEKQKFLSQLKYVLPDAILGFQFESLAVGFIRLLEEVFRPATAWSHQVITLLNSYVTLVRSMTIL